MELLSSEANVKNNKLIEINMTVIVQAATCNKPENMVIGKIWIKYGELLWSVL